MPNYYLVPFILSAFFLGSTQKSQSHTLPFKNENGVYGVVYLKTQATTVGYGYLWIQQDLVRIDGVELDGLKYTGAAIQGYQFPFNCEDCYFKASGVACINFGDQAMDDCGNFSSTDIMRGALGKSSPEVDFSESTKEKHNKMRRLKDINAWEELGFVKSIHIDEVKSATLSSIVRKLKRQIAK